MKFLGRLRRLNPVPRGLLLLAIYVATGLLAAPMYEPGGLVVVLLISAFFYFWIGGLVAEATGQKPSEQFWSAFGMLAMVLGPVAVSLAVLRLIFLFPAAVHPVPLVILVVIAALLANTAIPILILKLVIGDQGVTKQPSHQN